MPDLQDTGPTITISKKLYKQLVRDSNFLVILENAGVDNWHWYDHLKADYEATLKGAKLYTQEDEG